MRSFLDKHFYFLINFFCRIVTVRSFVSHSVKHHATVVFVEYLIAKFCSHSLLDNHITGNFSCLTKVRTRSSCNTIVSVKNFLRNTTTECTSKNILKFIHIGITFIFRRKEPCNTTGTTTRDNCYLVNRVTIRKNMPHKSVARFVEGGHLFFFLTHYFGLALGTYSYFFKSFSKVGVAHLLAITTSCNNRRFVGNVGKVCTR